MRVSPGKLLREARLRHLVTQKELAMRAGTKQSAISRIERDQVSPTIETLTTLLDLVGEELTLDAEPIEYGHDRTLLQARLAISPHERLIRTADWARQLKELNGIRRPD